MATTSSSEIITYIVNQGKREQVLLNKVSSLEKELQVLLNKVSSLEKELQDKNEELLSNEDLTQSLIVRDMRTSDELRVLREALLKEFRYHFWNEKCHGFGIKGMGELDANAFMETCKLKFPPEVYMDKAIELDHLWNDKLRDLSWNPFKVVEDGKKVVKEDDKSLVGLKNEWGEDCYNAVVTALEELNEYDAYGRGPVLEFWNFQENRNASPGEVISSIFKQMKSLKKRRREYKQV